MKGLIKLSILFLLVQMGICSITVTENPGCPNKSVDCNLPWIVEVINKPTDNGTEYHHLWGGVGSPTLISAQTPENTKVSVNWTAMAEHSEGAVTFSSDPMNIFGVSISEVILFDDVKDTGSIESVAADQQYSMPAHLFDWQYNVTSSNSSTTAVFFAKNFNGTNLSDNGGEIAVIVKNSAEDTRSSLFPKLQVKPSASNVDVVLDHVTPYLLNSSLYISNFTSPRYAIRLVIFSSEERSSEDGFEHSQDISQDDEYSPGVFKLDDISSPRARNKSSSAEGGYVEWRPVCYYNYIRDVTKSTLPSLSAPQQNGTTPLQVVEHSHESLLVPDFILRVPTTYDEDMRPLTDIDSSLGNSLAYSVLGESLKSLLSVETLVSFGATGDEFYSKYDFSVWTFTAGSGSSALEKLSLGVLLALLLGVALPMATLLVAGFVVKAYQCKKSNKAKRDSLLNNEHLNEET